MMRFEQGARMGFRVSEDIDCVISVIKLGVPVETGNGLDVRLFERECNTREWLKSA